jgi:hypothetical protein
MFSLSPCRHKGLKQFLFYFWRNRLIDAVFLILFLFCFADRGFKADVVKGQILCLETE